MVRMAGIDTTSIAITGILYHLMLNRNAYRRLTAEIDEAVKNGTVSIPISYADSLKLPYLKACINEGMRLHPSIALTMPREVAEGGAAISGIFFPEGYRIGINPAVIQYDKAVFGSDADIFNPDRWLHGDLVAMDKAMRGGAVVASFPVEIDDQIMLATSRGQSIRVPVEGISFRSRNAGGVKVFNTGQGEEVVSVAWIAEQADEAEIEDGGSGGED